MNIHTAHSRRAVLKSGGALIVSFSLGPQLAGEVRAQGAAAAKPVALTEVDSYLVIDAKGAVTLYTGKVDLGTGVQTALAQIAAEELDVPFARIKVVQGDTATDAGAGHDLGQPVHPDRRHPDPPGLGRRQIVATRGGSQAAGRQERRPEGRRRRRHRRRQARHLR